MAKDGIVRYSVSVPPDLLVELDWAKKEYYYNISHSRMLVELIRLGIKELKEKDEQ